MAIWNLRSRPRSERAQVWRAAICHPGSERTLVTRIVLSALCLWPAVWLVHRADKSNGAPVSRAAPAPAAIGSESWETRTALRGPASTEPPTSGANAVGTSISGGEVAKEQLRKSGQYESLGAAIQAARYAVEKIDPSGLHSRGAEFFAANPKQHLRAWFRNDGKSGMSDSVPSSLNP